MGPREDAPTRVLETALGRATKTEPRRCGYAWDRSGIFDDHTAGCIITPSTAGRASTRRLKATHEELAQVVAVGIRTMSRFTSAGSTRIERGPLR